MKKLLKNIGNFFKKIGLFIWKYIKIAWNYVKDNAWIQPIALVALIFALVFGFQGIVTAIDNFKTEKEEETEALYTKATMGEIIQMREDKKDFVFFIGSSGCSFCTQYKEILNKYIKSSGKTVYYFDISDTSDTTYDNSVILEWKWDLKAIDTRSEFNYTAEQLNSPSVSTPTTIVVEDGEFKDAKSGALGLEGGEEYLNFVKFIEGQYIGKVEG